VFRGSGYSNGEYLERDYSKILRGRTGDHVVILLGTNDAQWGIHPNSSAQLEAIASNMIAAGAASVRWMTIPPVASNATPQLKMYREAWVQKAQGTPYVVDATGALGPVLLARHRSDTTHLNAAGHTALAQGVNAAVC
jgi:lysophospholipase L1-like esterase